MLAAIEQKDYYKVLNLSRKATEDEIKTAFKKLALKWHPDRHQDDKEAATEKFVEINNAYRVLARKFQPSSNSSEDVSKDMGSPPPPEPSNHSSSSSSEFHSHSSSWRRPSTDSNTTPPSTPNRSTHSSSKRPARGSASRSASNPKPIAKPNTWIHVESHHRPGDGFNLRAVPPSGPESGTQSASRSWMPPGSEPHISPHSTRPRPREQLRQAAYRQHHEFPSKPNDVPKRRRAENRDATEPPQPTQGSHTYLFGYSPPVPSFGTGTPKEWTYTLKLSLEEIFHGKHCRFCITRYLVSNQRKQVILDVEIPPGCQPGTRIRCCGVGHQRRDGTLQDVVFIIKEEPHHLFSRVKDDLFMEVRLPWVETLKEEGGKVCFEGLDGEERTIHIRFPRDRAMGGIHNIQGAGMPVREGGRVVGRGDLIIRWEIVSSPTSKWQGLKKFFHLKK